MGWYIHDGQKARGPFSELQVVQEISAGRVRTGSVAPANGQQWVPLASHPPFAEALARTHGPRVGAKGHSRSTGTIVVGGAVLAALVLGAVGYTALGRSSARATDSSDVAPESDEDAVELEASLRGAELSPDGSTLEVQVSLSGGARRVKSAAEFAPDGKKGAAKVPLTPRQEDLAGSSWSATYPIKQLGGGRFNGTIRFSSPDGDTAKVKFSFETKERLVPSKKQAGVYDCLIQRCQVKLANDVLSVTAPPGTTITVGTRTAKGTSLTVPAGTGALLADANPRTLSPGATLIPVALKLENGDEVKTTVSVNAGDLRKTLMQGLNGVRNKGFSLPDDEAAPARPRLIAAMKYDGVEYFGTGKTVREIDLVALTTDKTQRGSCGSYRNRATGSVEVIEKNLYHEQVEIYDRRSGKLKASKFFRAPPEGCPDTLKSGDSVSSFPDRSAIQAFIKSQL